jgi:cytoskeletal protein CcmA (bactofilin family)
MECFSEQTCAIFVDGELELDEARRVRDHLTTCPRCRRLVDALRAENRVLSESLQELPEEATNLASFARLRWSWLWGDLAVMAAVLALGSIVSAWINKLEVPGAVEWVNPFSLGGLTNLMFNFSDYLVHGGTAMLTEYAAFVGGAFLLLLLGGSALLLGRRSQLPRLGLLLVLVTFALPSSALERRHAEFVSIPAGETIDDTLLVSGNTVRVDGVINGDLLAFAQTLEVGGTVKGDLVTFAKRIVVSGNVEGHIFNCSQSLDLDGQLGHSLYGWSQSLRFTNRSHVGDGIVAGADDFILEGEVKRSATIFAGHADVSGSIGRDFTMAGRALTLTDTARVNGNLTARVRQLTEVHIANGAMIAGKRDIQLRARQNRFSQPRFYFHQAIWLAAAMLVGWLGLILFPRFFEACTQAVGSGWRSLGLGFAVLVGVPLATIVAAVTLIGLPLSLMLFVLYLTALYLAKIWVGAFLGRIILRPAGTTKHDWLLGLLLGLAILTIVSFIPYLGGLVRFGIVCLGLGAFAWQLYQTSRPAITA